MKCPNCQFENRDDAKFCKACGFKLADLPKQPAASSACPNCGAALKPGAKFCSKCGSPVAAPAPAPVPTPEVKTETVSVPETEVIMETAIAAKPETAAENEAYTMPETAVEDEAYAVPETAVEDEAYAMPETAVEDEAYAVPETAVESEAYAVPENVVEDEAYAEPESPIEDEIYAEPEIVSEPEPVPVTYCKNCGSPLKPGTKFCPKCGTIAGGAKPSRTSEPYYKDRPTDTGRQQKENKKKKHPGVIILLILVILLLLGGGFFALVKTGLSDLPAKSMTENDQNEKDSENPEEKTAEEESEEETAEEDENISAELEEKLAPVNEQASAGEGKLNSEDYGGAASDLAEALKAYANIASEYDSQTAMDIINPLVDNAFALYTTSILKQVEGWESQSVTAPLYQQIDATLSSATNLAAQLRESNLTITTDELDQNYAEFPARYKEKYILTFNDLRTGDEWSRTTAWQYMQDAASVGLVNKDDPDDPLTLRYSYALAWITQRDISEGMKDGSVTTDSAISSILSLAENIDYNPVLMRDLALYYDATGDSNRSAILQNACVEVYNYLANEENIYINAEELFVPGRSGSNASSTIALNDFWYFNDFGEYAPSMNNGVSPEGREHIRSLYREAINSL